MTKKRKSITIFLLEILAELTDVANSLAEVALDRKAVYRYLYNRTGNVYSENKLKRYLRNLERQGYLKSTIASNQDSVEFTNKAKLKILDKLSDNAKSDKKNRFVSFDIPEPMRKNRNQFRRTIKRLGFRQIQKSLWVIDKNVAYLVELAAYEYHVEKYVIYIVSEKTDIDGVIKKILQK